MQHSTQETNAVKKGDAICNGCGRHFNFSLSDDGDVKKRNPLETIAKLIDKLPKEKQDKLIDLLTT